MSFTPPANLFLLPSFISQDLSPDGVHLTAVSGLHYILHLFDQTAAVLALDPREPEFKLIKVQEAVRHHDDRLSYLESRHSNLQRGVNLKMASDSEFRDWVTNRSEEDWLTIRGLRRLGQMSSREWQVAVRRQITSFLKEVCNLNRARVDFSVVYVSNPVRNRTTGMTVYNVRLSSAAASIRIRELYSGFFRHDNPVRLPHEFNGISVRNKVTLATRIRIRVLQQFANNYVASNPGSSAKVTGYDPRPLLITTPPRGSTTERMQTYNFIEACTKLPSAFSDDALAQIFQVVGTHHQDELRSIFIVLSDDDRDRCLDLAKNYQHVPVRRGRVTAAAPAAPSVHFSGVVSGAGTGMEVQNQMLRMLASPPPPPPPPRSSSLAPNHDERDRERSDTESDRRDPRSTRGLKRAHLTESSKGDHPKKKSKRSRRDPSSSSSSSEARSSRRSRHTRRPPRSSSISSEGAVATRVRKSRRRHDSGSSSGSGKPPSRGDGRSRRSERER